jgi:hypothetical protein
VPDELLRNARDFYDRMDKDMDQGVQMSREWVANPNLEQRCRMVANKLLTALENDNHNLGRMMAGYILSRLPNIALLNIDTSGDVTGTLFQYQDGPTTPSAPPPAPAGKDKLAALSQAGNDVSRVFRAGKQWKFSVYDHQRVQWSDSPAFADQNEAEAQREQAVKLRYQELIGGQV